MTHVQWVLWAGLIIGVLYGATAQRIEFCLSGGLREWRKGQPKRVAAFILAIAVAILATQILAVLDFFDLRQTLPRALYLQPGFSWLLIPLGGLVFGCGMILARGCGSRALVLLADGNLRSLLVLFCLGISAFATLTGPLAHWRLQGIEATTLRPPWPPPSFTGWLQAAGAESTWLLILPAIIISLALTFFALVRLRLLQSPGNVAGSVFIGLLIPAGWVATGYLGADDFDPVTVESLTFVAPIGESIQYLMISTGVAAGFGITVVAGVLIGSLAASLVSRSFEWRGFESVGETLKSIAGGILMGIGGALALGCSVGQGLSGMSTLALPSFLATLGIWTGAWATLRVANGSLPDKVGH